MMQSSLWEQHMRGGAEAMTLQGWRVVRSHADIATECRAVREGAGVIDLSHLGRTWLRGTDAQDYLHRQLSRSIRPLAVGEGCHAVHMNAMGQMIGELTLHRTDEQEFLALTMPVCTESLASTLERFIFGEDCTVEREAESTGLLSIHGPRACELLERTLGDSTADLPLHGSRRCRFRSADVLVLATALTGVTGRHLMVDVASLSALWEDLLNAKAMPFGWAALDTLRIEAGIPLFGVDHDSGWIPTDAGLEATLDFEKGCFPGQEVVAKIRNIGHPRWVLRGFVLSATECPPRGTPLLLSGQRVGSLSSVGHSPPLGRVIALGHLRWKFRDSDGPLQLGEEGEMGEARVANLPFLSAEEPGD
ncbi:aminomethyltransferase family protein [Candidatus Sumerlaeota bacterium]|nr:aminomethyltransferase family protein [Candidatus Sumerlaeota bacterium]